MKIKIAIMLMLVFGSMLLMTCTQQSRLTVERETASLVELVKEGKSELFKVPFARYEENTKAMPIGVFDSGIGGLTVLAAILELDAFNNNTGEPGPDGRADFEHERFVYLGD